MRREFLRGYVGALLFEGGFRGIKSPVDMAKKAVATFAADLPAVLGEIAEMASQNGTNRLHSFILGKIGDIAKDLDKRGPKAVWKDIQAQYARGMEVNAARRAK